MAMEGVEDAVTVLLLALLLLAAAPRRGLAESELRADFYSESCPEVEEIVRSAVGSHVLTDPTLPAALLRLVFHDCQVQGCDGSILLESVESPELLSPANLGIRRVEVVHRIKEQVESVCPGVVSCADLIVLASSAGVGIVGGPLLQGLLPLGRRDGLYASALRATAELPPADISVDAFLALFGSKGMTLEESVAILGSHTLGVGHCPNVMDRLYPRLDPNLGVLQGNYMRLRCPPSYSPLATMMNDATPLLFDTQYFGRAQRGRALFTVDSEVARDPRTAPVVAAFAGDRDAFFAAFASAFIKLSLSGVNTGAQGEVRTDCRQTN